MCFFTFNYYYDAKEYDDYIDIKFVSNGEEITNIEAETAVTSDERYTGLSEHTNLEYGNGMIFIYEEEKERNFVMNDMDFGIDILFISKNCKITEIENADKPTGDESGTEQKHTYSNMAKFIIEVPINFTEDLIQVGDKIKFEECN